MSMDLAERALLEETVRAALAGVSASGDAVLADLGWLEMLDAEPDDAIGVVFEALGAANAASSALDDVLATAMGVKPRADLAVMLPPFGSWEPPGDVGLATVRIASARRAARRRSDRRGDVGRRPAGARASTRPSVCTPCRVRPLTRSTRTRGSTRWRSDAAPSGHETLGASRAMLALAREHALERVQFGRPIASFQAVRHRLAESLVAVEALDATLRGGSGRAESDDRRAREGDGRSHGAYGRGALPAGAGGDRVHDGSRVPPLLQANDDARRVARVGRRDRPRSRPAAPRRSAGADAHRALIEEIFMRTGTHRPDGDRGRDRLRGAGVGCVFEQQQECVALELVDDVHDARDAAASFGSRRPTCRRS